MSDLTPQELEEIGASDAEIEEASKGVRTLHASVMNRLRDVLTRRRDRKKQDDECGREELGGRDWDHFVNMVRGERRAREQQRRRDQKALDEMTHSQYDAWKAQRESEPPRAESLRPREVIALQDARTADLKAMNRAREERAEGLGLPKAQRDWQRREDEITRAVEAKRARLREEERAISEWARQQREENGDLPPWSRWRRALVRCRRERAGVCGGGLS